MFIEIYKNLLPIGAYITNSINQTPARFFHGQVFFLKYFMIVYTYTHLPKKIANFFCLKQSIMYSGVNFPI